MAPRYQNEGAQKLGRKRPEIQTKTLYLYEL